MKAIKAVKAVKAMKATPAFEGRELADRVMRKT
jgi:hypothetical protein